MATLQVSVAKSTELLPADTYTGTILSIDAEMRDPKPEFLKPGQSATPYEQWVIKWDLLIPESDGETVPFLSRIKNLNGRGPNASMSKFLKALGMADAREIDTDTLIGRKLRLSITDTLPEGDEGNWIRDFSPPRGALTASTPAATPAPNGTTAPVPVSDDDKPAVSKMFEELKQLAEDLRLAGGDTFEVPSSMTRGEARAHKAALKTAIAKADNVPF